MRVILPLFLLVGCGLSLTSGGRSAEVLPGTWDCSDGGTISLNEDGSGETDCTYFIESICGNDGSVVSSYTFTWDVVVDPDVVNNNFGWDISEETRQQLIDSLGCTVGEGGVEEPLLSVSDTEVRFGFSLLGSESVFQSLTR